MSFLLTSETGRVSGWTFFRGMGLTSTTRAAASSNESSRVFLREGFCTASSSARVSVLLLRDFRAHGVQFYWVVFGISSLPQCSLALLNRFFEAYRLLGFLQVQLRVHLQLLRESAVQNSNHQSVSYQLFPHGSVLTRL